jgi:hypothetical protein
MSSTLYGPVRRAAGILGLLALAPTGVGLLSGTLSPADAAIRAAVTLVVARVVARAASVWLRSAVERPGPEPGAEGQGPATREAAPPAPPRRRATDDQQTTN